MQVLCATIHEGKIIVGCQYGLLVFWDLVQVVSHHQHHHHCHHEGAWYGEEGGWTTPCYCCSLWAQVNSSDDDYDVQSSWYLLIIGDHLTKMFFIIIHSLLRADDFSSAAISNIHVDATELITDDYDGVVILRFVTATHYQWTFVFDWYHQHCRLPGACEATDGSVGCSDEALQTRKPFWKTCQTMNNRQSRIETTPVP